MATFSSSFLAYYEVILFGTVYISVADPEPGG
jgi:hypothetical protein